MSRVGVAGHSRAGADLGSHDHRAGDAARSHPASDDPLSLPGLAVPLPIVVRCIQEGAACLQEAVQDRERGGLAGPVAEVHRAQAQLADTQASPTITDRQLAHRIPPFSRRLSPRYGRSGWFYDPFICIITSPISIPAFRSTLGP